jgi:hypothetical protein
LFADVQTTLVPVPHSSAARRGAETKPARTMAVELKRAKYRARASAGCPKRSATEPRASRLFLVFATSPGRRISNPAKIIADNGKYNLNDRRIKFAT